ncbi:MAG: hypothetical protein WCT04_02430 [Planctomycetota bacterium]
MREQLVKIARRRKNRADLFGLERATLLVAGPGQLFPCLQRIVRKQARHSRPSADLLQRRLHGKHGVVRSALLRDFHAVRRQLADVGEIRPDVEA